MLAGPLTGSRPWPSPFGPACGGSENVPALPAAQALGYCDAGLALPELPAFVTRLLKFQRELVRARDAGAHTVAEVEPTPAGHTLH
jgi:alkanesulfonate monooxygenase SsuD/methylene tetrahydromethanopterin reductase-like flavin-dependent oxidoreductase (luciferase family)